MAAERRDAAAVEAGGAGGSSGPVPENIGEAGGAGADGDAASGKGAAAAPTAASSSGGAESGTGEDAVPEEVVEAAKQDDEAVLVWLDGGGRVNETFEYTFEDGDHSYSMPPPALPSLLSLLILAASAASTQWDSLSPVTISTTTAP